MIGLNAPNAVGLFDASNNFCTLQVTFLGQSLKTTHSFMLKVEGLAFASQPRTQEEAVNKGYFKMSPDLSCTEK